MKYEYQVPLDIFKTLAKGQTAIIYSLITKRTGEGGTHFYNRVIYAE